MSLEASSSAAPNSRPTDFRLSVARLRKAPDDARLAREHLEQMAAGGNPSGDGSIANYRGVREELYPGWTNEDFQAALDELDRKPTVCTRIREGLALLVDNVLN